MPKSRKQKPPVTCIPYNCSDRSSRSLSGHHLIRKFHILLKLQDQLLAGSASMSHELEDVRKEIESLGGLEAYQRMSARGQGEQRGGGSEKVFVGWLTDMGERDRMEEGKKKLSLLEVGAVKPNNYAPYTAWINCTPIDLHSRHPLIQEQDFLKIDLLQNRSTWDAISLSLVVNFVPNARDRGRMLSFAHSLLQEEGYLFLVLPLPCVANSRYLDFDHLRGLMSAVGFSLVKERWNSGGKMGYWLYQKRGEASRGAESLEVRGTFGKKKVLRDGRIRNNFAVLL